MFESIRALVKLLGGLDEALETSSTDGTIDDSCSPSHKVLSLRSLSGFALFSD